MIDTFTIYSQWCLDTGRIPPTREWWNNACAQRKPVQRTSDFDFDVETEQREGWGYEAGN